MKRLVLVLVLALSGCASWEPTAGDGVDFIVSAIAEVAFGCDPIGSFAAGAIAGTAADEAVKNPAPVEKPVQLRINNDPVQAPIFGMTSP